MPLRALLAEAAQLGVRLYLDHGAIKWSADREPPAEPLERLRERKR